jgi:hypothetical protein
VANLVYIEQVKSVDIWLSGEQNPRGFEEIGLAGRLVSEADDFCRNFLPHSEDFTFHLTARFI